jgi:hypothetical protein
MTAKSTRPAGTQYSSREASCTRRTWWISAPAAVSRSATASNGTRPGTAPYRSATGPGTMSGKRATSPGLMPMVWQSHRPDSDRPNVAVTMPK